LPVGVDATFGIYTASTDDDLLDAVLRVCRLLETPRHIRQLAHFVTPGTQPHRIRLAAQQITLRYREPLRMEEQPPSGAPAA